MLALCCAVATPVQAAPAGSVEDAEARGHRAANESRWREAAEALAEALKAVPNDAKNRGRRNQLASEAVTAYKLGYDAAPDCGLLNAGLALADDYLKGLSAKYGAGAMLEADYSVMSKLREELAAAHQLNKCPDAAKPVPTPTTAPGPGPTDQGEAQTGSTPTEVGPAPGATTTVPPSGGDTPPARRSRVVPFAVGLGVSAGLTLGMAVGSGILFSQLRKPGGSRYEDMYDAARDSGMPTDGATDMCAGSASDATLSAACSRWDAGYRGFVAMAVLSGVFAVSTGVFTGLLIHEKRRQSSVAQAWRRHQVEIGAAPRLGGATVTAGFRF